MFHRITIFFFQEQHQLQRDGGLSVRNPQVPTKISRGIQEAANGCNILHGRTLAPASHAFPYMSTQQTCVGYLRRPRATRAWQNMRDNLYRLESKSLFDGVRKSKFFFFFLTWYKSGISTDRDYIFFFSFFRDKAPGYRRCYDLTAWIAVDSHGCSSGSVVVTEEENRPHVRTRSIKVAANFGT